MERSIILAALADPAVKAQLMSTLEPELARFVSDPATTQPLVDQVASQIGSNPRVRQELISLVSDPEVQQALLASIDIGMLLQDPVIADQIKSQLNLQALLADPSVTSEVVTTAQLSLKQRLAANDDGSLDNATLVAAWPMISLTVAVLYAILLAELGLTAFAFTFYIVAFVDSTTFQWVWLFIPHIVRAVLGVFVACTAPTVHSVLHALVNQAPPPAPGEPLTGPPPPLLPPELSSSLLPLLPPLGVAWLACLLLDMVALIVCLVWCHLTRDLTQVDLIFEQAAFVVLLLVTLGYWLINVAPLFLWPLLRWALPPAYSRAITQAVGGAISFVRAKISQGATAAPAKSDATGKGDAPEGKAKRESTNRLLGTVPPPPPRQDEQDRV